MKLFGESRYQAHGGLSFLILIFVCLFRNSSDVVFSMHANIVICISRQVCR